MNTDVHIYDRIFAMIHISEPHGIRLRGTELTLMLVTPTWVVWASNYIRSSFTTLIFLFDPSPSYLSLIEGKLIIDLKNSDFLLSANGLDAFQVTLIRVFAI